MVLVSSYPKSGATWFRFLSYSAIKGEIKKSMDVRNFYPEIFPDGSQDQTIQEKINLNEVFLAKTHLAFENNLPFEEHITHVVYIVRNPFDSLVSRLNHYRLDGDADIDDLSVLRGLINNANKSGEELGAGHTEGGWNYNVNSWLNNPKYKLLILRYEDLLETCTHQVFRMKNFLPFEITEENMKKSCSRASFIEMKNLEKHEIENEIPGLFYNPKRANNYKKKGVQFINKGKKGNYKDYFDQETFAMAKEVFAETMKKVGYDPNSFTLEKE